MDNDSTPSIPAGRQAALFEALVERDRSLADMYLGAVMVAGQRENPERFALAAHSIRELMDTAPRSLNVPARNLPRLGDKVTALKSEWNKVKKRSANWDKDGWAGQIDAHLHGFLSRLDEFFAWQEGDMPTRKEQVARFLRDLDPLKPIDDPTYRALPEAVEDRWLVEWQGCHDYMTNVLHHKKGATPDEFTATLARFEGLLLGRVRPQTFTDRSEIDLAIARVEADGQTPDEQAITAVQSACHLIANYEYFFAHIQSPAWIAPLAARGYFRSPPAVVSHGEYLYMPEWAASRYLARVAVMAPDAVADVIDALPRDIANARVYADFIDAAIRMPGPAAVRVAKRIQTFAASPYVALVPADKFSALIAHLAHAGHSDMAFNVARSLLTPRAENGNTADPLLYDAVLGACLGNLSDADLDRLFDTLCRSLAAIVRERPYATDEGTFTDNTWFARPAIEANEQNMSARPVDTLIDAVRDVAEHLVRDDISTVEAIVRACEEKRWSVFRRLALHLLRVFPDRAPHLVVSHLMNRTLFRDIDVHHEYALLLQAQFEHLTPQDRSTILGWIDDGPDRPYGDVDTWMRDRLSLISTYLPVERERAYQGLVALLGPARHPEFRTYMEALDGPISPLSDDEMAAMGVRDIVEYLKTWIPTQPIVGPSLEGLRVALHGRIAADPAPFAAEAQLFAGVPLQYVLDALEAFRQAASMDHAFPWQPVLTLCAQTIARTQASLGRPDPPEGVAVDGARMRLAILDLLAVGFGGGNAALPSDARSEAWGVLASSTDSLGPGSLREPASGAEGAADATVPVSEVRGKAIDAVIRYARWVTGHRGRDDAGPHAVGHGLDGVPEARSILEAFLDPDADRDPAVYAAYGRHLSGLADLDPHWVSDNIGLIFPADAPHLREATWGAYVRHDHILDRMATLLRAEYARAIDDIDRDGDAQQLEKTADGRLAYHLMTFYWRGLIGVDDEDGLISRFFSRAPAALRAHALHIVGWTLWKRRERLSSGDIERLERLWEWCAARASTRAAYDDLAPFGLWFASGELDDAWSMAQLEKTLRLTPALERTDRVVERLATLARTAPLEAARCLRLILKNDQDRWSLRMWTGTMRDIFARALDAPYADAETRRAIADAIHRLGAVGIDDLRDLLPE